MDEITVINGKFYAVKHEDLIDGICGERITLTLDRNIKRVVFCNECGYRDDWGYCDILSLCVAGDFFCARGKMREEQA